MTSPRVDTGPNHASAFGVRRLDAAFLLPCGRLARFGVRRLDAAFSLGLAPGDRKPRCLAAGPHLFLLLTAAAGLALLLAGCGNGDRDAKSEGKIVLQMWHTQQKQNQEALQALVTRFNDSQPKYFVKLQNLGDYKMLFEAARTRAQGGELPDLCIVYESMVAELMEMDVVAPLDDYFSSPEHGLSREDQADFFPSFLASNHYAEFGNRLLSFPFTKSLLMLYYNAELMRAAGHERPPATWADFIGQCRDITAKTGQPAYAYARDPSSFDSMIFSLGGQAVTPDGSATLFDSPQAVKVLDMLQSLIRGKSALMTAFKSEDDRLRFTTGKAAFILRSCTSRSYMREDIIDEKGRDRFDWGMACPPVGEGQPQRTVLFGGNICVFKSKPGRQLGAWEFIKFFTSPAVTAEWSVKTGYLPVRRSAEKEPVLQKFFADHPRNRAPFDTIPYGVPEPNLAGWQTIRDYMAETLTVVCKGTATPEKAAADLAKKANAELERRRSMRGK